MDTHIVIHHLQRGWYCYISQTSTVSKSSYNSKLSLKCGLKKGLIMFYGKVLY